MIKVTASEQGLAAAGCAPTDPRGRGSREVKDSFLIQLFGEPAGRLFGYLPVVSAYNAL
jgi:hypothetical protein